jgi:hypothetical protein
VSGVQYGGMLWKACASLVLLQCKPVLDTDKLQMHMRPHTHTWMAWGVCKMKKGCFLTLAL